MSRRLQRLTNHDFIPDGVYSLSRIMMMEHLGYILKTNEIVHHINHNNEDNRMENLQVMSRADHARHHTTIRKGYKKRVTIRDHKFIPDRTYYCSRMVMMEHLGRVLETRERVYHINGDLTDDRIENLTLNKGDQNVT